MKYEKVRRYPYEIDWRKLAPPPRHWSEAAKAQWERLIKKDQPQKEVPGQPRGRVR
jgi:hypothetical protein